MRTGLQIDRRRHLKLLSLAAARAFTPRQGAFAAAGLWSRKSSIRVGAQTNAYAIQPNEPSSFIAALEQLRGIGFEGFETGFRNVAAFFAAPEETRSKIAALGLTFFGVHIFMQRSAYDPQTLIAPRSVYEPIARGGKALGAQNVIVSGAPALSAEQLQTKVAGLDAAGRYCQDKGIGFAYHNEEPDSGSQLNELDVLYAKTSPSHVRFVLDAGHLFNVGGDVVAFIRLYHSRIVGLHLRDYKNRQQVVLGSGDLPLRQIGQTLHAMNWSGWVEAEEERLDGVKHGDSYLRPAYAALKEAFLP